MDKCPGLIGGLNDPSDSCNIQCPVEETISGVMEALPGNNPLGAWGVDASGGSTAPATTAPIESSSPSTTTSPVKSSATSAGVEESSSSSTGYSVQTSSEAGDEQTTSTAVQTVAPTESSAPAETITTAIPTTIEISSGGTNTMITSYISETTVVWTTVTATSPTPSSTSSSSSIDGWSYYGCYSDSLKNGARVMTGIEFANVGQHAVTNTKCVAYCGARGYSMAGTEYGGQCFCANTMTSGTQKLDDSKCNMACEGGAGETCGGSLALSVYLKDANQARRLHNRHLHQHIRGVSN